MSRPNSHLPSLRRSGSALVLVAVASMLVFTGCRGAQVRSEADVVRRQLEKARQTGAYRCAPRELAVAETNQAFAERELLHGDADRAAEHVAVASASVLRAIDASKDCASEVLIREQPVVVQVVVRDTDGDGLNDPDDRCPLEPGPVENQGCPILDTDGDGIPDDIDRCPLDPEDFDGFEDDDGCPDPDNDQDGVLDVNDECPLVPGPASNRGCPVLDTDGDGILDDVDACPDEPGLPELNGCPPQDRDGDGLPDHLDRCPDEPGPIEEEGCPKKYTLVVLKKERIEISEQIHFATGKHAILPASFELMNQIAQVLKDHPTIKLRIEGHTDSIGNDALNLRLSQRRANSVREYLIEAGIGADRLVAIGFGETMPIASNASESGRSLNRRVEFNITER